MVMPGLVWSGDTSTNEKAIVHVIDDVESLREALNGLLWSVGLETRTYGSVGQFLDVPRAGRPRVHRSRRSASRQQRARD
jgi:hypothetical protein